MEMRRFNYMYMLEIDSGVQSGFRAIEGPQEKAECFRSMYRYRYLPCWQFQRGCPGGAWAVCCREGTAAAGSAAASGPREPQWVLPAASGSSGGSGQSHSQANWGHFPANLKIMKHTARAIPNKGAFLKAELLIYTLQVQRKAIARLIGGTFLQPEIMKHTARAPPNNGAFLKSELPTET